MTQPAVTLARDALGRPYAQATFLRLANELLNRLAPREVSLSVDGGRFADAITGARLLATATLADRSALHVLAVELPRGATVERARTLQRDFIARHLKDHAAEAALAAFYTPGEDSWRLSLVTLAADAVVTDAGVATRLVASPAKRYSYLVGPSELTRTAEEQLLPLLADTTSVPTLAQLEAAFAVEPVSEAFYASYREHYLNLKEDLERLIAAPEVASEFQQRGITAEGFAKRLMGQLVFLYFLQRKGWLGVPEGGAWGTGPKDFIKRLRRGEYFTIDNLYNDALEPLFYEALAKPEGSPTYRAVGLRFPFLNGGLFEAYRGYDWRRLRLPIPNATLEGALDTLDAYNFTVREDHPLEQEVAVDPEMLGRVFERLLDVRERKNMGAHYTRREIVHYLVQDTLIAHVTSLATPPAASGGLFDQLMAPVLHPALSGVSREALRAFFLTGDPTALASPEELPAVAAALDAALRDMRVLDPAIGSGAFPLGFLNEVTRAREALTPLLPNASNRSQYDLKRETIEASIYGVDIEPSAVDISKLRLWLSLVVDEDDADGIEPLPNLDYKILTGNSLYTSEGLILDQDRLRTLETLKQEFFSETDLPRKQELRARIDNLLAETLEEAKRASNIADFDVRLVFSEVFTGPRKGFDAVIGNPPYVRIQNLQTDPGQVEYLRSRYYSAEKHNFDLYVVFVEAGLKLLHDRGHLAFILPHKFFNATYGENLRTLLSNKRHLRKIVHFGHYQMFEGASTYVCLLFLSANPNDTFDVIDASDGDTWLETKTGPSMTLPASEAGAGFWVFRVGAERQLLEHLKTFPLTLGRITSRISQGIRTSGNQVYVLKRTATPGRYYSKYLDETVELEDAYLNKFLSGREIDRYTPPQTDQVVILPYTVNNGRATLVPEDTLRQTAPKTHAYLLRCKDFLENREEGRAQGPNWYGYLRVQNIELMRMRKILVPDTAASAAFTYDPDGRYALASGYGITLNQPDETTELFLLGLLNSSVLDFYIRMNSTPLRGGYFRYFTQFLEPMPLPTLDPNNQRHSHLKQQVAMHARRLLELHDVRAGEASENSVEITYRLTCIDDIAIELYGLPSEMVALLPSRDQA